MIESLITELNTKEIVLLYITIFGVALSFLFIILIALITFISNRSLTKQIYAIRQRVNAVILKLDADASLQKPEEKKQ